MTAEELWTISYVFFKTPSSSSEPDVCTDTVEKGSQGLVLAEGKEHPLQTSAPGSEQHLGTNESKRSAASRNQPSPSEIKDDKCSETFTNFQTSRRLNAVKTWWRILKMWRFLPALMVSHTVPLECSVFDVQILSQF